MDRLFELLSDEVASLDKSQVLIVQHSQLSPALVLRGKSPQGIWQRHWSPDASAAELPPAGPFELAVVALPRGRAAQRLVAHQVAAVLMDNGEALWHGANSAGIRSADAPLREVFASVTSAVSAGHGRVWRARTPIRANLRPGLNSWRTNHLHQVGQRKIQLISYPGLFAGGELDAATALLLANLPAPPAGASVLDFACGIGVIARALAEQQSDLRIAAVDHDPLALRATCENVAGVQAILSGSPKLISGSYDLIVSNPPIHDDHAVSYHVVEQFIGELPRLLRAGGAAWIVTLATVPVRRFALAAGTECIERARHGSFVVQQLSRPR